LTLFTVVDIIDSYDRTTLKKALKKLEDGKLYSTEDIFKMGVIVNTKLEPSMFTLYRLIKNGKLSAVDVGAGQHSRHFVKGEELKRYLKETYKL
jgi:hypothetical protein